MKKIGILLLIVFLFCINFIHSAIYYVDSTNGNDFNNGLSESTAWKTTSKVTSINFNPGDNILFKRGETWREQFNINISGSIKNPITYGAYGNGARPKFVYNGSYYYPFSIEGENIIIENLSFSRATNSDGYVLYISRPHVTLKNSEFYFQEGFSPTQNDCIKLIQSANYTTIENCIIYGAPNQGIDAVAPDNLIIRNNTVHDCQNAVVLKGGVRNALIEDNLFYNFKYGSIGIGGSTYSQWKNDIHEAINITARRNVIYYNTVSDGGGGIFFWGAYQCSAYQNTIYGNSIELKTGGDPDSLNDDCSNNEIFNNIIWRTGPSGIFTVDTNNDINLKLGNNIYYKTTGSGEFKVLGTWVNYLQWITNYNYDNNYSKYVNPIFNSLENNDFSIQWNSPAIDAGAQFNSNTDILGNPIYGSPDIGAYEYQPPYNININAISVKSVRIYTDGKYRFLDNTNIGANLKIYPINGWASFNPTDIRPQWMDVIIKEWNTPNTYTWTENSIGIKNITHILSGLTANSYYNVFVNGNLFIRTLSESRGILNFTYNGEYSVKNFSVIYSGPICGDSSCNYGETCSSCPQDCITECTTPVQNLIYEFKRFKSGSSLSDYITKIKEFIFG
jgi:parallel beta-helix repeat protein